MESLTQWLNNKDRKFNTGVKLYNAVKISTKHDAFFATQDPTPLHMKMLHAQLVKLYAKNAPARLKKDHSKKPVKAPLVRAINLEGLSDSDNTPATNINLVRKNKVLTNKFLTLEYSMLSPGEKAVFFNDENYFQHKKALLQKNGDIEQNMRSIHTKMKNADLKDRQDLIYELAALDDKRATNFEIIDTWTQDNVLTSIPTDKDPAAPNALELDKKFRVNKSYIYRAEKMLPNMKESTAEQREKKNAKQAEIQRRIEENKSLAIKLGYTE